MKKDAVDYLKKETGVQTEVIREYIESKWFDINIRYNSYRGYNNITHYIHALANWLNQFESVNEKVIMLNFLSNELIFVSEQEIRDTIKAIIPDILLPIYTEKYDNKAIYYLSQTIFLGMSDGAHMDLFRYYNKILDNHQICMEFELADSKCKNIIRKIQKNALYSADDDLNLVLLDDFSGSGIGYLRNENIWKGKIIKTLEIVKKNFSCFKKVNVFFIPYLLTEKAYDYISNHVNALYKENIYFDIIPVRYIEKANLTHEEEMIIKKYYHRNEISDSNYLIGEHTAPYLGFDHTQLCLVLYHNTPNNSIPIIWYGKDALFPRKNRHKVFLRD